MSTKRSSEGFTLVELLIGVAASAILLLLVGLLLWMPFRSLRTNNEYATLRRDVAYAVALMTKDIRSASLNAVVAQDDLLQLPANATRTYGVEYQRNDADDSLDRYVDGTREGGIITDGLMRFRPVVTNDLVTGLSGVVLNIEIQNPDGEIVVQHGTFIHARN